MKFNFHLIANPLCVDWEVRRLGMRERVKPRNDKGLRIWIFSQKIAVFCGKKKFQRQI